MKTLYTFFLIVSLGVTAVAKDYYCIPKDGRTPDTGDGSQANPWDFFTAVQKAELRPGDTVWLNEGTYQHKYVYGGLSMYNYADGDGSLRYLPTYVIPSVSGTPGNPIIFRAMPGAHATINGCFMIGFRAAASNLQFRDLDIGNLSIQTRYDASYGGSLTLGFWVKKDGVAEEWNVSGINVTPESTGIDFINCFIHDNVNCGIGGLTGTAYGCITYHNGFYSPGGPVTGPSARGHGFYIQNKSKTTFQNYINCISVGNNKIGMQVNGTTDCYNNINVNGLIAYQNGHISGPQIDGRKDDANGWDLCWAQEASAPIYNSSLVNSCTWNYGQPNASTANTINGVGTSVQNFVMTNNYITCGDGGIGAQAIMWSFIPPGQGIVKDNTIYGISLTGTYSSLPANYPNNTYGYTTPTTGTEIFVMPNAYEVGRAHIAIYNWSKSSAPISVDVSKAGLSIGDRYELRQCQDYWNDVAYGTYDGTPITIAMTGHTVCKPVGTNLVPEPSSFPQFGAFVIKKSIAASGNLPPSISEIADLTINANSATAPLGFTVGDASTPAANLIVTASSASQTLVPNGNIALGGSGANRTVTVTPAPGQSGSASIIVNVSDSMLTSSTSFNLTVLPLQATNVPSDQLVVLGFEAESGVIAAPMVVGSDPQMPSLKFIQTTVANSGTATYTVNVPTNGTYVIWCKVLAPSYTNDSYFVSMDGAEDVYDEAEGKQSPSRQWSLVTGRDGTSVPGTLNPRAFNLSKGQHTLVFRGREAFSMIDRILICNDRNYVPAEVVAANDSVAALPNTATQIDPATLLANDSSLFASPLRASSVSAAQNGEVAMSGGMISYKAKAGFLGKDAFIYTATDSKGASGTATVTVNVQGAAAEPPVLHFQFNAPNLELNWSGDCTLMSATNVLGPWADVPTSVNAYTNSITSGPMILFRLRNN